MEKPTQDQLKQQISAYYKTHLASGLKCEVKGLSMTEVEETGGHNITANVSFIHNVSGESEESKVLIPCDAEGHLDWTNTQFLEDDHPVDPSKASHPEVKSPEPLPANNQKPKAGGGQPPEKGTYIQKPEKVGAQGGKKIKGESKKPAKTISPPKRLGNDELGWPTADQLELEESQEERRQQAKREGYVHGEDDWGDELAPVDEGTADFDSFEEAGVSPAMMQQAVASRMGESMQSPEGYVHGQDDLEETMKGFTAKATNGGDIPLALIEYRTKTKVEGTTTSLFEFGVLFADEETRDAAKTAVEAMDGVEAVELLEDVGIAVVCRMDESAPDPIAPLAVIPEALGLQMVWEEGQKEKFKQDLVEMGQSTHNYSDNKGEYRSGVQTDANEPGAPKPAGGQQSPTDVQGGPKKRKHTKTSGDQGGDGLGGAKSQATPSVGPDGKEATKDAGQKAESLAEQDFLDDVMTYDTDGEDGVEDEGGMDDEMNGEAVELDDTIMSLVAAQAEHGVEVVLQVAREKAETEGSELSPEQEGEIRSMFAEYAEDGGMDDEEDDDMEVTATEVTLDAGSDDDGSGVNDNPFESQQEDVNISVNDGGDANVSSAEGDAPTAEPATAPDIETSPATAPAAPAEPAVDADDDDEGAAADDEPTEPSEKPESDDDDDDEDKPGKEEALKILRDQFVDELVEMQDEVEAIFAVEDLSTDELLALDEMLPPPGEDGRFKQLKQEPGSDDLAAWIGRKKHGKKVAGESVDEMCGKDHGKKKKAKGKKKKKDNPGYEGQAPKAPEKKLGEEGADQVQPNPALSFVDDDTYSYEQHIAAKNPQDRTAQVLKPGKFSLATTRHANMVARRLARQGFEVNRVDAIGADTDMKVGELNQELSVGLPEESLVQLSGARFKRAAIEKLTVEQKGQLKEKLMARGNKLAEDQQNSNTMGGPQNLQRVRGKNKSYNMYGRLKPDTKWKGMVRVVWDDGEESWEKPGDIENVGANPYNVKGPSGGPTKPGSQKMSKAAGEELDMLKSLESVRKLPRDKRFAKAIELQTEGQKLDDKKLVSLLTEGWDEWENYSSTKLIESVIPSAPAIAPAPEEVVEDDDSEGVTMLVEDFGGNRTTTTISDEELEDE